ncbi:MAG: acyl-CoA desaturase [Planctomycetia bacterium]|nr:acyl-CoA desaturase [Planctomycetia bacterium]
MYLKTLLLLAWFAVSYGLLVFVPGPWWAVLPLALSLGLAMAAIGFNVQHDGSHSAYSDRPWVNRLMALTLDFMGASSYVWSRKHNVIHHSYTNIVDHDDDINIGFLGRLAPHQPRFRFHRWQHYYLWGLYGFLYLKWTLYDDFRDVLLGRIGGHRLARPRGWDLATFLGGKAVFFTWALVVPLLLHPTWQVLSVFLLASFVLGVMLSVVFQLAHCVEEASFPLPAEATGRMESAWAAHQVETTVDFGRDNRLLSWYVGGLNFQIEHHLFPHVCHIHYPALSQLVEETCREYGLRYTAHRSLLAGLVSHFRQLRRMGLAPTV